MRNYICIWYNPNKDNYYHKVYQGFNDYKVGRINQYNHKLVYKIDLDYFMKKRKISYTKMLINDINRFLDKLVKKI